MNVITMLIWVTTLLNLGKIKALFGILALVLLFACGSNTVIYPDKPKTNHETFSYKEGDTTYVMQKYFLVMLKKGPNREHSKEEAAEIQKKHMEHIVLRLPEVWDK